MKQAIASRYNFKMYFASAIVFAVVCHAVVIVQVNANLLKGMPDDMSLVNISQLNSDMFRAAKTMYDLDNDLVDLQDYIRQMFLLIWRAPLFDYSTMHRYDNYQDKLVSGGPKANQTECGLKLAYLLEELRTAKSSLVDQSNNYKLFNLLDSFGRPAGSFLRGDVTWLGDYDQCIKARYKYDFKHEENSPPIESSGSRYCLAHLRWPNWRRTENFNEWTYTTVKSAVCLPEECDSIGAELDSNKQIITQLIDVNFGAAFKNFQIGSIYCLPDKQSPLTQWWRNSQTVSVAIIVLIWFALISLATIIDCMGIETNINQNFVNVFALTRNTRALFKTNQSSSSSSVINQSQQTTNANQCRSCMKLKPVKSDLDEKADQKEDVLLEMFRKDDHPKVDLNYLHCIKALTLFIVLKTHMTIGASTAAYRVHDLANSFRYFDAFHYCFAGLSVNMFFILTGLFTSYNLLKRHPLISPSRAVVAPNGLSQPPSRSGGKLFNVAPKEQQQTLSAKNPLLKPSKWIHVCLTRYLRVMPLWAVTTLVVKYATPYLGSGPLWDYGTSNGTNYYQCQQESWIYLLLGIVNIRPMYHSCTPSAWYLAIDLQCAILIAPLLMMAYIKAPRTTFFISLTLPIIYFFHYLSTDIYVPDVVRKELQFGLDSYASYTIFFHDMLNYYHYSTGRIAFYIMGMTAGVLLHLHKTCTGKNSEEIDIMLKVMNVLRKPILSNWFTIALLFLIQYSPGLIVDYLPEQNRIVFNTAIPFIAYGWAVLFYSYLGPIIILQMSTSSLGNSSTLHRFFNWPGWIVLARINLSLLLVDPLIIGWMTYRMQHTIILNLDTFVITMIAQTVIIYLFAIFVYLLVESPLKNLAQIALAKRK